MNIVIIIHRIITNVITIIMISNIIIIIISSSSNRSRSSIISLELVEVLGRRGREALNDLYGEFTVACFNYH